MLAFKDIFKFPSRKYRLQNENSADMIQILFKLPILFAKRDDEWSGRAKYIVRTKLNDYPYLYTVFIIDFGSCSGCDEFLDITFGKEFDEETFESILTDFGNRCLSNAIGFDDFKSAKAFLDC